MKKIYVHKNIKFLRKRNDMSRERLAKQLDTTVSIINNIEAGNAEISLALLVKAADLFGVSTDALLSYDMANEYTQNPADPSFNEQSATMPLFMFDICEDQEHFKLRYDIFVDSFVLEQEALKQVQNLIHDLWGL